jgi:alanyl-tRNA synthetase
MTANEIRRLFLEFFRSKGHEIVPSDSLVPADDPTLLFTGAGMNQFKEKFLGRNITYTRASSSQKCLRTGDLENVGRTSGHHTFFEMLGNFSFGDYFKKEAISWAWEFFTAALRIPPDRLWVSVYKDDDEAYLIWKDIIKVPERKIIRFGEKENFWPSEAPSKGPNGPCGPCSEMFYDYGADTGCGKSGCTPACDCGRFIEVWNLVFTQYDRQPDGGLKPLPSKNIDTGMGLERIASVMQSVRTNFDTDIFAPITGEIKKAASKVAASSAPRINAIADHIRAVSFCIADGVMPSNEERGYVVRKLIRRAMLHARDIGIKLPSLYKLVSVVADVMRQPYPELFRRRDDIAQVVKKEEEAFLDVIDNQLPKVDEAFEGIKRSGETERLPSAAFNFYDTYGMPYEMLEEIAERHSLKIDRSSFDALLEKQREMSRSKTKLKGEIFTETFAKKVASLGLVTEFTGYDSPSASARVLAVLDGGEVILDRTPFYGESGGQAGDRGKIETPSGVMEVEDAKKIGSAIVHIGRIARGSIAAGETAEARIDEKTRARVKANHTATHLLQAALRKVLGEHVRQTGSLVDSAHLRFDFTHMKKMEDREIRRVEDIVNENIAGAIRVDKSVKDIDTAKREGATALFGEKYDSMVRVVSVAGVSSELCGGTHVDNTGEIGLFRITGESSIASGVRRIEAVTGSAAEEWVAEKKRLSEAREKDASEKEALKSMMAGKLREQLANVDSFLSRAAEVSGTKIVTERIEGLDIASLRVLADKIKAASPPVAVILATESPGKVSFIVALSDDLAGRGLKAGALAKEVASSIDGSGGGKDNFAQGGGKAAEKLGPALEGAVRTIKERLR